MKKFFLFFKRILYYIAIVIIIQVLFLLFAFKTNLGDCPRGPLSQVDSCEKDGSRFSWMNSGWYYFLAKGPISGEFCELFFKNGVWLQKDFFVVNGSRSKTDPELFQKVSCKDHFKDSDGACFKADRVSSNGNTHFFYFIQANDSCTSGIFFQGSRRYLKHGNVEPGTTELTGR